jgi:hypothetical protein
MVTDQGSNFVRLLKQKMNKYIEEDNTALPNIKTVDKEVDEILDEVNEIKDIENINAENEEQETIDEDQLKEEEGGKIIYIDDIDETIEKDKTYNNHIDKFCQSANKIFNKSTNKFQKVLAINFNFQTYK